MAFQDLHRNRDELDCGPRQYVVSEARSLESIVLLHGGVPKALKCTGDNMGQVVGREHVVFPCSKTVCRSVPCRSVEVDAFCGYKRACFGIVFVFLTMVDCGNFLADTSPVCCCEKQTNLCW